MLITSRKLNISLVSVTQSYFKVPKDVRLTFTQIYVMKIPNKRELQQIVQNDSSEINFKDFIKIYKKDATLGSNNPLRFRKSLQK